MSKVACGRVFEAPRAGAWEIDLTHSPRPVTRYGSEIFISNFMPGFAASTKLYGLLLEGLDYIDVNGFMYVARRTVGGSARPKGPPPKLVFKVLTVLHPAIRRRLARSREAVETRAWLADLRYWDEEVKPAAIREHLAIQRVAFETLDDDALARHIQAATVNGGNAVYRHGRFTLTAYLPIGDYLAHAIEWTGEKPHILLRPVKGFSEVSHGVAASEAAALIAEIAADPAARRAIETCAPEQAITWLRNAPGALGQAAHAWFEAAAYHIVTGYDLCDYAAIEMPEILIGTIKAGLAKPNRASETAPAEEDAARLRDKVPQRHRDQFDDLLADACRIYRLREERDHYNDGWAAGLLRLPLLHAGRRLAERGRIEDAEFILDAVPAEVQELLTGSGGPTNDELKRRTEWRKHITAADVPQHLGFPKPSSLPKEWLPPHQARLVRALETFLSGLFESIDEPETAEVVRGFPVSPGVYEGTARLVLNPDQFGNVRQGDILVTHSTSPYFNVLLPLLGGIVTDSGGALSHAAIVSREYGIPGVVGTNSATRTIKDGDRLRMDGNTGEVRVIAS